MTSAPHKKINFPRLCLPPLSWGAGLLTFQSSSSIFGRVSSIGALPGVELIALLPVLAVTVWFAISLGVTLGILNVFFRDVGHFFSVVLQFWFWLTPIVYPASILPDWAQALLVFNPLTHCIGAGSMIVGIPGPRGQHCSAYLSCLAISLLAVRLRATAPICRTSCAINCHRDRYL